MKKKPKSARKKSNRAVWMSRTALAIKARIDRNTVRRHLAADGAPRPNSEGLYNYRAVVAFIEQNAENLKGGRSEETRRIKESMLRMEAEDMEIELNVKRGRYVDKETIKPTIAAFMAQLTADLRAKFEQELPPKYAGRSTIEAQRLNADAVDWTIKRIKHGATPISA